jgi:hypothetical protein
VTLRFFLVATSLFGHSVGKESWSETKNSLKVSLDIQGDLIDDKVESKIFGSLDQYCLLFLLFFLFLS